MNKKLIPPPVTELDTDVLVLGGGLPGVCAAIQAAESGASVILVERSAVLGGNCGPEVGVHPSDGHRFHPYMPATGIVGRLIEDAAFECAKTHSADMHYNISTRWDGIMSAALKKAGVTVLRCHYAHTPEVAEVGGEKRITAVICEDTARYRTVRINVASSVIDDTGDGNVSERAGAGWRMGREAKSEYGERSGQDTADSVTLGTSLVAIVHNAGHPVEFVPPEGTPPFSPGYGGMLSFNPRPTDTLRFFYPTETGGEIDTIEDDDVIYERLLGHLYSAWNRVKNEAFVEESRNWELLWISPRTAKRESRRFFGDYTLTQSDAENGVIFPDAIACGGFALDVHDPRPETPEYIKICYYSIPPVYTIPYRCIYSRDVANLLFASRLLSATHMAHGTVRLQRTLAAVGQAAGAAAALCRKYGCGCREIYKSHIKELQQTLFAFDSTIPGILHRGERDIAPTSKIFADSETKYGVGGEYKWIKPSEPSGCELWEFGERVDRLEFLVRETSGRPSKVRLRLLRYSPEHPYLEHRERPFFDYYKWRNEAEWGSDCRFSRFTELADVTETLPANFEGYLAFEPKLTLEAKNILCDDDRVTALLTFDGSAELAVTDKLRPFVRKIAGMSEDGASYIARPGSPMYKLSPAPDYGEGRLAVNGVNRRFCTNPVNMWLPEKLPAALTLSWDAPHKIDFATVVFDTMTRTSHEMPYECSKRASDQCVKSFRAEFLRDGKPVRELEIRDNHNRFRRLEAGCEADCLRLTLLETFVEGAQPGVYEVCVYEKN